MRAHSKPREIIEGRIMRNYYFHATYGGRDVFSKPMRYVTIISKGRIFVLLMRGQQPEISMGDYVDMSVSRCRTSGHFTGDGIKIKYVEGEGRVLSVQKRPFDKTKNDDVWSSIITEYLGGER